jgi:DNA-directed RNA polymerase subunit RPC12/RpoP
MSNPENHFVKLTDDELRKQLHARKMMRREMYIFLAVFLAVVLLFLLIGSRYIIGIVLFGLFLVLFRTLTVWYQWNFLTRFDLQCAYCKRPLGGRMNLLRSPTHECPHCGRRALAPIRQLEMFEQTEKANRQ